MYQELQIFEDSFDRDPVWGIEGDDVPWPTMTVGDLFEHSGLPNIDWRRPPSLGQVLRVSAVKHAFRQATSLGPSADHVLQVVVSLDRRQEADLEEAESALENQRLRGNFLTTMLVDSAQHNAPVLRSALIQSMVSSLKVAPAQGIEEEANSAWEEAAMILQADGHMLADVLRGSIASNVSQGLKDLGRENRLTLWLADMQIDEWFSDDWASANAAFDPLTQWPGCGAMDQLEEFFTNQVVSRLMAYQIPH